ncbi:MAG: hypothetical protein K2O18_18710 [Oscillospiraceae bacterium]|nr:hypothetical protein [Oscillospiraceae bacterium]
MSTYAYYMNPYRTSPLGTNHTQGAAASGQQMQGVQQTPQRSGLAAARRPSDLETPVQPVDAVRKVNADAEPLGISLPIALSPREGADPAEMAVRMRIQPYEEDAEDALGSGALNDLLGLAGDSEAKQQLPGLELSDETSAAQGTGGAQEALEDGKCETCEKRKYQDGSDDMSVSFQSPTNIKPEQVASAVRGHEMEHVVHEQAKARQEDRKVVSQNVTLHTDICPECGKVYISGGETTTVTKANPEQPDPNENKEDKEDEDGSKKLLAA